MSSPYVFVSERGSPLSVAGYQRMVARAGEAGRFSRAMAQEMLDGSRILTIIGQLVTAAVPQHVRMHFVSGPESCRPLCGMAKNGRIF
jgi:hypothetical protein